MNPENQNVQPPAPQAIDFTAVDHVPGVPLRWALPGLAGVALFVLGCIVNVSQGSGAAIAPVLFMTGFVTGFFGLIIYIWQYGKIHAAALAQFLTVNGFVPEPDAGQDIVATSLLGVGNDQRVTSAFGGQYKGHAIHGAVYQYSTGGGKSRETHFYPNLCIELSQEFPLVLLEDRHKGLVGMLQELPERIPNGKQLQLEGNFNDRFQVTVLPGTEQEVLQFMTPDFMAELMQMPKYTVDIEIEGNKLFIITPFYSGTGELSGKSMHQLFMGADVVLKHLGELAFSWQASTSAAGISEMAATALAPRTKVMFGKRHAGWSGLVVFLIYATFNFLPASADSIKAVLAIGIVAAALAALGYEFWRQTRQ